MATAGSRRRIHLTETPRLAAILKRHSIPGEPRTATLVRLVERADALTVANDDFLIFDPVGPPVTNDDVARLEEQGELDQHQELAVG